MRIVMVVVFIFVQIVDSEFINFASGIALIIQETKRLPSPIGQKKKYLKIETILCLCSELWLIGTYTLDCMSLKV